MRMFRIARLALCAVAAAAVSGCIQSSTLIKMKPDGSGTIEQTMTMNADAVAQFSALAAMGDDKAALTGEAADLIFHLLVLLADAGVSLDDVRAELKRREGVSGIDEKASRPI